MLPPSVGDHIFIEREKPNFSFLTSSSYASTDKSAPGYQVFRRFNPYGKRFSKLGELQWVQTRLVYNTVITDNNRYRDFFIEGINKKIIIESNLRPQVDQNKGYVFYPVKEYFSRREISNGKITLCDEDSTYQCLKITGYVKEELVK